MSEQQSTSVPDGETSREQGRYQRSPSGMVGALLVTLLVILAFVGFRACNRSNLEVSPEHVDYLAQVGYAQQAGARVVYPASLPSGWYATQVTFDEGPPPELVLSMLTPEGRYVGFVQSPDPAPTLLARYVDGAPTAGSPAELPGSVDGSLSRWDVWTDDGGDTALVTRHDGATLLAFGTAPRGQLEELASHLTTAQVTR
jgi:hypothetical protein